MAQPQPLQIHIIYLDSTLGAEWIFGAMRAYFIRFQPFIAAQIEPVQFAYRKFASGGVSITVPVQRDRAPSLKDELTKQFPNAVIDLLVYEEAAELSLTLDARASTGQRFGTPE